jgi:enamine deaminase RidA (YjgF/YER057c/UK114 family)
VRPEFFPSNPPASTLVQVACLAIPGALIEIEAVALID